MNSLVNKDPHQMQKGFTLIELVLGISIFALISLTLAGTFWAGVRLSRRSEGQNVVLREVRWSLDLMARELENMTTYDFSGSYSELTGFSGEERVIQFMINDEDKLKIVRYYLQEPEKTTVHQILIGKKSRGNQNLRIRTEEKFAQVQFLVREETDFIDFLHEEGSSETQTEVLAMNVREGGLKFSYGYAGNGESDTITWRSTWQDTQVPGQVRIEIEFLKSSKGEGTSIFSKNIFIPSGILGATEI